jgi:tetratricopeptide (TPR) repeat protein
MRVERLTSGVQVRAAGIGVVTRATTMLAAVLILIAVTSDRSHAFGSKEKTPEEQAAENQKKAVSKYNDGVGHMEKARAIGVKGDSAYAYNYRATSDAKARKEFEKAVKDLDKAVELDSRLTEAYNNLGYCHRKLGNLEESLKAYEQALQLKPDFPQAREYRGEAYLALGQLDKANADLDFLKQMQSPYADTLAKSIEIYHLERLQGAITK